MHIAILTFEGFNELDSIVAYSILNRARVPDWRVSIACPDGSATSMNGMTVQAQATLEEACEADAVVVGSGARTRDIVRDPSLMSRLRLDPERQLIAAQCSGVLILARLGLLGHGPATPDLTTRPWVQDAGVTVLEQPFPRARQRGHRRRLPRFAVPRRLDHRERAGRGGGACGVALRGPVGEKDDYVARAMGRIAPYIVRRAVPA
jgi:putative intracellular protease/amidase